MSEEILIVDDNADIRNIINELIIDAGYKTRLAANYNQALSEIDKTYYLIGSLLLVFCYIASTNNGYRMIHSIFLLPLILGIVFFPEEHNQYQNMEFLLLFCHLKLLHLKKFYLKQFQPIP